jgi:N-acetylglucosamine kinase-like BadF-type ATPase
MKQAKYVIGIDGGGTKTAAVVCDLQRSIQAEAHTGPSNALIIGFDNAAQTILDLIEECRRTLGCSISQFGSIVAGLSGMGRESDRLQMESLLKEMSASRGWNLTNVSIETDARIALEGAFGGKPGIVMIAGTGSLLVAKDARGIMHRAGGWGRIIGDEGSGYSIGREALRAVAYAIDGTGPKTLLVRLLAKNFGLDSQESIINAVYKNNLDIAGIAPAVIEAAAQSDAAADRILRNEALGLTDGAGVLLRHFKTRQVPLAFAGSLLSVHSVYSKRVEAILKKRFPKIRFQEPEQGPVLGAALTAIRKLVQD